MKIKSEWVVNAGIIIAILGACYAGLITLWTRIQRPELTETQLFFETWPAMLAGMAIALIGYGVIWIGKKRGG